MEVGGMKEMEEKRKRRWYIRRRRAQFASVTMSHTSKLIVTQNACKTSLIMFAHKQQIISRKSKTFSFWQKIVCTKKLHFFVFRNCEICDWYYSLFLQLVYRFYIGLCIHWYTRP